MQPSRRNILGGLAATTVAESKALRASEPPFLAEDEATRAIRQATRKYLRSQMDDFINSATGESLVLMNNILVWWTGHNDPTDKTEVSLATAFNYAICCESLYFKVPPEHKEAVRRILSEESDRG